MLQHRVHGIKTENSLLTFITNAGNRFHKAAPNAAHFALAALEQKFDVTIVTQNIDDLHERAGSKNVLHLHGEIFKSRSTADAGVSYPIDGVELNEGDKCEKEFDRI